MIKLLALGNQYVRESDWKDLALIKFCLCAMGIMIGAQIPASKRKGVTVAALVVFLSTYVPLMAKLFTIALRKS